MSVAYLITAYKSPHQLARLVRRIEFDVIDPTIVVHVDRKADIEPYRRACRGSSAHFLTTKRRTVNWGAFSMVRAMIGLIDEVIEGDVSHAVLLSEQCYPLVDLKCLELHLQRSLGLDFIDVRDVAKEWPEIAPRFESFSFPDWAPRFPRFCARMRWTLSSLRPTRHVPGGLQVYAGSVWWVLSRESLDLVSREYRSNRRLRRFFAATSIPEEMYFHTILANSSRKAFLRPTVTYARFDPKISANHPLVWTLDHVRELEGSGCYLARKFDDSEYADVLDHFDRRSQGSPTT